MTEIWLFGFLQSQRNIYTNIYPNLHEAFKMMSMMHSNYGYGETYAIDL